MFELTPEQINQMDANIRQMLAKGASQSDINQYASDFKIKFGKKKSTSDSEPSATPSDNGTQSTSQSNSVSPSPSVEKPSESSPFGIPFIPAQAPVKQDAIIAAKTQGEANLAPAVEKKIKGSVIFNPQNAYGKSISIDNPNTGQKEERFIPYDAVQLPNQLPLTQEQKDLHIDGIQQRVNQKVITPDDNHILTVANPNLNVNSQKIKQDEIDNLAALKVPVFEGDAIASIASIDKGMQNITSHPENFDNGLKEYFLSDKQKGELQLLQQTRQKYSNNIALDKFDAISGTETEGVQREDLDGNKGMKLVRWLADFVQSANPLMAGAPKLSEALAGKEFKDSRVSLKDEYILGAEWYKAYDPVMSERMARQIKEGLPMSQSQIAQVETKGAQLIKIKADRDLEDRIISPDQYLVQRQDIQKRVQESFNKHPEVLYANMMQGIGDQWGVIEDQKTVNMDGGIGYVPDSEIERLGKDWAKQHGLNENSPEVLAAIEKGKKNEGAMIFQNAVPKKGILRDIFLTGVGGVAQGIGNFINGKSGNDAYIEGQSAQNVNVADNPLEQEKKGYLMYRSKIAAGVGQFAAQAALAYAGGAVLGGLADGIEGLAAIKNVTTGITIAEDAGLGIAEVGNAAKIGSKAEFGALKGAEAAFADTNLGVQSALARNEVGRTFITAGTNAKNIADGVRFSKDFVSTAITSYAQSYDSNFKQAQQYTADDDTAHKIAAFQSTMEGLSENVLSPIEVVRKMGGLFKTESATKTLLKIFTENSVLAEQKTALDLLGKSLLKGAAATTGVILPEIAEEFVTKTTDLAANAIFNPATMKADPNTGQERNVWAEYGTTALETGLSMAIPGLVTGIGSAKASTFEKSSLLFSGQTRQTMLDILDEKLANNQISEKDKNTKELIINTAANINDNLPLKEDGSKLNPTEKENFVYARVQQAIYNEKLKNTETPNYDIEKPRWEAKKTEISATINEILGAPGKTKAGEPLNRQNETTTTEANNALPGNANQAAGQENKIGVPTSADGNSANSTAGAAAVLAQQDQITVGEMIDKTGTYKGQRGTFVEDGQTLLFKPEGSNKEYEIGNTAEVPTEREKIIPEVKIETVQEVKKPAEKSAEKTTLTSAERKQIKGDLTTAEMVEYAKQRKYGLGDKYLLDKQKANGIKEAPVQATEKPAGEPGAGVNADAAAPAKAAGATSTKANAENVPESDNKNAADPQGRVGNITEEAEELLQKVKGGGVPAFMTSNMRRIALDNGVSITKKTKPNDIIAALQIKREAVKEVPLVKENKSDTPLVGKVEGGSSKVDEGVESDSQLRTAKLISNKVAVEHAGYQTERRVTSSNENKLEIDGHGTILTSTFINTLVNNGRLPKEALKKRQIQLSQEYANELINKNSDLFPRQIQPAKSNEGITPDLSFAPAETQYAALDKLTKGISDLPAAEQKAEIERRAAEHDKSYQQFVKTGDNKVSDENMQLDRVKNFGGLTAKAMTEFLKNPKKYEGEKETFANGSRFDENGKVINENDFVSLKQRVKELRAEKNTAEIDKINAAPAAYLKSISENKNGQADTSKIIGGKKGNQIIGRTITKTIANGEKIEGTYKIVSADDVIASHNEVTFAQSKNFPQNKDGKTVNDRDYEKDKNAQSEVIKISQNLDDRAITQTPVISKDGIVLDGNNRTMSRKLAATRGTDAGYIAALKDQAELYGIDASQIDGITNPMLVFEATKGMPYTTETFKKFNTQEKKEKSPVDKAIEISKVISDNVREKLFRIYGDAESPSDITSSTSKIKELIDLFQVAGLLQSNEIPRYFNAEKLTATKEGNAFLENVLLGSALTEDIIRTLDADGMGNIRKKVISAIVPLVKNSSLKENSLISELGKAISIHNEASAAGISITDYVAQLGLFDIKNITVPDMAVAVMLDESGFKKWVNSYNKEVGSHTMFGTTTKESISDVTLKDKIKNYEQVKRNLANHAAIGKGEAAKNVGSENKGNGENGQNPGGEPAQAGNAIPIRQLGTGDNVYFESNKYRVNDAGNGKILLNVGNANDEVPLTNIEFDNVNEAVFVAKKLEENAPEGLTYDFHDVDKIIGNYKKEFADQNPQGNLFAEPQMSLNFDNTTQNETTVQNKDGKAQKVQFETTTTNGYSTGDNAVQREGAKGNAANSNLRTVEQVWSKDKNLQFTGSTTVKDAADVAHIMRLLEDKSVEHGFAVHIDKKGKSHIQLLSIGGVTGTVVDPKGVIAGAVRFKAVKTYLVHNHPSGNMNPSQQDIVLTKRISSALSILGIDLEHVIMDTYSQEYITLNNEGFGSGLENRRNDSRTDNKKLTAHKLDEMKALTAITKVVKSVNDVARFIYGLRFSAVPKSGMLVLNNRNGILGNYVFKNGFNEAELMAEFVEHGSATGVILYGNQPHTERINEMTSNLKNADIKVVDYVNVKGGGEDVKGAYDAVSSKDTGLMDLLYDTQEKYGTNRLSEPSNKTQFATGKPQTPINKAKVQKIIDFFEKGLNLKVFAPLNSFGAKLKELGYSNLQAMVEAYHGSPYDFDKFSSDKIGTGEGNQSFGHGLYFSNLKAIAEDYANKLVGKDVKIGDKTAISIGEQKNNPVFLWLLDYVHNRGWDKNKILEHLRNEMKDESWLKNNPAFKKHIPEAISVIEKNKIEGISEPRNIYKVTLHEGKTPAQYDWLEWNKSVSPKTADKIVSQFEERDGKMSKDDREYAVKEYQGYTTNAKLYNTLSQQMGGDKAASGFLLKAGIDGVKYPADTIGAAVRELNGTNYVVFDNKAVTVKEKIQFLSTPAGKVLGFVSAGKIYLNPDTLSPETTFHELTHIQQALIELSASKGDKQAQAILKRFDDLMASTVAQIEKGNRSVRLSGVAVDLRSSVYDKAEGESDADYKGRIRNELWAYLQAPANAAKWDKANKTATQNFIQSVKDWFVKKLGLKNSKDIQSLTLEQLIDRSSNSLMKGEYFNLKNEVSSQKINNITNDANNIITAKKVFERFSQAEQRGFAEGGQIHAEASLILAANEGANGQAQPTIEEQEASIEKYAKEKGVWVDNVNKKYGGPTNSGEEALVWGNPKTKTVTKAQNTFQYGDIQQKLDSITLHNTYFPEAPLKVIGFGKNSEGDFQVIVEQPFVDAAPNKKVTTQQLKDYMAKLGFENTEENNYANSETLIEDLHTGNAILTPAGNIVVIDPIMRLNTPEQGYGGTREVSNKVGLGDNPMFAVGPDALKEAITAMREAGITDEEIREIYTEDDLYTPEELDTAFAQQAKDDFKKANIEEEINKLGATGEDTTYDSILHRSDIGTIVETGDIAEGDALLLAQFQNDSANLMQKFKDEYGAKYLSKLLTVLKNANTARVRLENQYAMGVALENEIGAIRDGMIENEFGISPAELSRVNMAIQSMNKKNARTGSKLLNLSKLLYNWYGLNSTNSDKVYSPTERIEAEKIEATLEDDAKVGEAADNFEENPTAALETAPAPAPPKLPKKTVSKKELTTKEKIKADLAQLKQDIENLNC